MSQTRYRWMLFIVLILVISNIILAFLLTGSKTLDKKEVKKKPEERVSAWYAEVGLEQHQIDTFKLLKEDYFQVMKPKWNEIRLLKDSLYTYLHKSPDDTIVNNLLLLLSQKNMASDKHTFSHFAKLRTMCTPEQQIRFDTIIPKLVNRPWNRQRK